ncbi:MAG TPA: DUF2268 domain-containing putative Zn-dependent protease [Gammaproteobacteria bacterium]|nr:DUF2268 domain-containing putative Zn-dependent protease [Gammaproteobacteria bacterium]
MLRSMVAAFVLLALCGFTTTTLDPDQAEIVTTDVDHFWQAFDDAAKLPAAQREGTYAKEYLDRGSQGLKDFMAARHLDAAKLAQHVEENRAYYAKVRPYIGEVVGQKATIQADFRRLKDLYPAIKFPRHVYFVVGAQHGAGMNSDNGIILAAEMFATPPGTAYSYNVIYPDYVPFSVVHETIHFNQTFQTSDSATLLQQVVSEGTADFIASLVVPEPDARQMTDRWRYGCAHEAELDARFPKDADKTDLGPWMFNHTPDTGWPPDMGYWFGYRIDQSYFAKAKDRTQALRTMLEVTDFKAYLKASGYPDHRQACAPEQPL